MFSFIKSDIPVGVIKGGNNNDRRIYLHKGGHARGFDRFIIDDEGILEPLPTHEKAQRDVIFITGKGGSGKSYWVGQYAANFKKDFKVGADRIILFRKTLEEDPVLDKIGLTQIAIDDEMITDPIDIEELAGEDGKPTLVIFDDTDNLKDKTLQAEIARIKNDVIENGRKLKMYLCLVSHQPCKGAATKSILNGATKLVFFPAFNSGRTLKYCLDSYCDIPESVTKKFKELHSRWICLSRDVPTYITFEKGVMMFDPDEIDSKLKKKARLGKLKERREFEYSGGADESEEDEY